MTWIWLRGLGRETAHWGGLPRKAELATGERVVTLDLPGVGRKRNQDCPLDMKAVVEQLREETADLGHIKILAVSLGGLVGLHWASMDPRVKQVVLINSSTRLSLFSKRLKPFSALRLLSSYLSKATVEEREKRVLATVSNSPEKSAGIMSLWAEIARRRPVSLRQVFRQILLAAISGVPKPRDIAHCTLQVIASSNDRLVSSDCSRKLAHYYHCTLVTHPTAGHDLPLDDPDWLLRQIETPTIKGEISPAGC